MLTLEQQMILDMGGSSSIWNTSSNERGRPSVKRKKKNKTFGKNKKK